MNLIKMHSKDVYEKYEKKDVRDDFTADQRFRYLEELEYRHNMAIAAGGPDALQEYGLPWVDYDAPATKSGFIPDRNRDRKNIQRLRRMYGEDAALLAGDRGNGKTFLGVFFGVRFYEIGYEVASNISLDFGYRFSSGADLLAIIRSPQNMIWIADEVHQSLNRFRQGANFQRGVIGSLAGLRKNRASLFGITSQEWQLGMDIKSQFKWAFFPFKKRFASKLGGFHGSMAPYMKIRSYRFGPWPDEWRGMSLVDKKGLPMARGGKSIDIKWTPLPQHLVKIIPALYGSFVGLPTVKQSGGAIDAKQMKELDVDDDIHMYNSVDEMLAANPGVDRADIEAGPSITLEEYMCQFIEQVWNIYPMAKGRINKRTLVTTVNTHALARGDETYDNNVMVKYLTKFWGGETVHLEDLWNFLKVRSLLS